MLIIMHLFGIIQNYYASRQIQTNFQTKQNSVLSHNLDNFLTTTRINLQYFKVQQKMQNQNKNFQIFIRNDLGHTTILDVKSTDSIRVLRKKIYFKEGWIPDQQRQLSFKGRWLEDGESLGLYGIKKEEQLRLRMFVTQTQFEVLLRKNQIKQEVIKKMIDQQITTFEEVRGCSQETLAIIGIPLGQILKLKTFAESRRQIDEEQYTVESYPDHLILNK